MIHGENYCPPLSFSSNIFTGHPWFHAVLGSEHSRSMEISNYAYAVHLPERFLTIHTVFWAYLSTSSVLFPRMIFLEVSSRFEQNLYINSVNVLFISPSFSFSPKSLFTHILVLFPYYLFQEAIGTFSRVHYTSSSSMVPSYQW